MPLPLLLTAVLLVPPAAVISTDFPDPDVIRAGSTYYAYSTSSSGRTVPVASAPSATGPWTIRGDALLTKPKRAGQGGFWAPDVSRRADGRYLMYFVAPIHDDRGPRCIGAARRQDAAGGARRHREGGGDLSRTPRSAHFTPSATALSPVTCEVSGPASVVGVSR
ncbi:family 43 glycosylhydrolase [Thermopolyspora sp. NPDC052614]|uniref:family 43 glycosylhydrolase n=1 Tax=Thermopolyspora sp. NPDC052614 TaxID=3155682 RepID=UPI00341BE42F